MAHILVLANETIAGEALLDAIRARHEQGDAHFHAVVPMTRPRHGNVIYDEVVRDSAQLRVNLVVEAMHREGIDATGEVGDPDPMNAAMDAIAEHGITEIIVSTLPADDSGWMKRDLPESLHDATGLDVEHVVVDLEREGLPFEVTLVVANQTMGPELFAHLREIAERGSRRFVLVVPQDSGDGRAIKAARERLRALDAALDEAGITAAGMIGDPDPFIATMNAVNFFHISDITISTLPEDQSAWVADKLVERVQRATNKPVEHVVSSPSPVEAGA